MVVVVLVGITGCILTYVGGRHGCIAVAGRVGDLLSYFQKFQGLRCFSTLVWGVLVECDVLD
jgi:hypothetical protein